MFPSGLGNHRRLVVRNLGTALITGDDLRSRLRNHAELWFTANRPINAVDVDSGINFTFCLTLLDDTTKRVWRESISQTEENLVASDGRQALSARDKRLVTSVEEAFMTFASTSYLDEKERARGRL